MAVTPSVSERSTQAWVDRNDREEGALKSFQLFPVDALIQTKLYIPQVQPGGVSRPRLLARLQAGVEGALTLLSAPPGFGKTTLLSEWVFDGARNAHGARLPVAWLTLDEHDNDPARFGNYLLAALAPLGIRLDEFALASVNAAREPFQALFTALVNQVMLLAAGPGSRLREGFALVLDDHHLITDGAIHASLAFLLTHLPPQMHVMIATRVDPALPLAQLRARGQLLEVRADELRFRTDEMRTFLQGKMGLDLPDEALALLDTRTEGWVAGLQLAALAMQNRVNNESQAINAYPANLPRLFAALQDFTGSHRFVVDYLAEQALDQQPPAIQEFLLATSILERLSAPLCEALLSGTVDHWKDDRLNIPAAVAGVDLYNWQQILEYLERSNLFLVALDDQRIWFRYHPLFASFLRERLKQSQPERWQSLHRRAAEVYERDGLAAEAVDHILAVGNANQAVQIVEEIAEEIWMGGEMIRLLGWLEALPEDLLSAHPRLCIFHAWILNILGDYDGTRARLRAADAALQGSAPGAPDSQALTRGMLAATRAIVTLMAGEAASAIELSQQALETLPPENWIWRSVVIRNLGNAYLLSDQTALASQHLQEAFETGQRAQNLYLAIVCLYELAELQIVQGLLLAAYETCQQALDLAAQDARPGFTLTGAVHVALSEVLRQWNDLDAGVQQARSAIDYGLRGRSLGIQVCGYTRLALLARARGDLAGCAEAFQRGARLVPLRRQTSFISHHDIQGSLWGQLAEPEAAVRWAQANGLLAGLEPVAELNYRNETAHITLVRILLKLGHPLQAVRLAERLASAAEHAGRHGRLIEILVLQALAYQALDQTSQALDSLHRALLLAEPQGYLRVFVDEGQPLWLLLKQMDMTSESAVESYKSRLLAAFPWPVEKVQRIPPTDGRARDLPEPLSDRELEILRLLATGLGNGQIAGQLVLAPSTIHWYVKNIYSKLGVHSRTQAVAQARTLGLLA